MTMTSDITIIPEASALEVDTSRIDVSEVASKEDKEFLSDVGTEILQIIQKAALDVGERIVKIQDRFKTKDNPQGAGLVAFYRSIGIDEFKAARWACKYRSFKSYRDIFGEENARESFNQLSDIAASKLWNLPVAYREAFLADIDGGVIPTVKTVEDVSKRPEVQLSKAEELRAAAKARKEAADDKWELVKSDPEIPSRIDGENNPEYTAAASSAGKASRALAAVEKRIAELEAQIEAEKLNTAHEAEEKAKLETQLQKLKFDDATARSERVNRVGSNLTLSIPSTLSDVQKFFAEQEHYTEETRKHIYEQCKYLADYIGDQL